MVLGGCSAGFRTSQGSATAPSGMSGGTTNSLVFSDEGGLLSRLGLGAIGVAASSAAIKDARTTKTTTVTGDRVIETTTQSATIDTQAGAVGAGTAIAAGDERTVLSGKGGGLAANLEVAGQSLGGDTSGWQYDMGGALRLFRQGAHHGYGVRAYAGIGYGTFDLHGRQLPREDRGPPMLGDGEYKFAGLTARVGAWAYVMKSDVFSVIGTETFVKVSANAIGPHTFAIGQRLQLSLLFVELQVMRGTNDDTERSIGLTIGAGI